MSGDLISRQAVLDCQHFIYDETGEELEVILAENVLNLPSVNPQEIVRDCTSCRWSKDGCCAGTEECHLCMWKSQYKSKTGHWIGHREHCENLGVIPSGLGAYKWCSNCDCGIDVREWHRNNYNYCPNCGCRMVKPQETQESDHKCHTCKHYTSGENDGSCGSYICKNYSDWESEDKE